MSASIPASTFASTPASSTYIGRFAPSPTGPLHLGSLVAAMASYLDARTHHGTWQVRIEDVDGDRNVPGADRHILGSLQRAGMLWDGDATWQSQRGIVYQSAIDYLGEHVYPCGCSRKDIADAQHRLSPKQAQALVYPGTCRHGLPPGRAARALRLRVPQPRHTIAFVDRWYGLVEQDLSDEAGDFVVKRADGFWPINWRWWPTTARRASPTSCAAPTCSTRRRARSICNSCSACASRATCMCRWCSTSAAKNCPSRPARRPSTTAPASSSCWPRHCCRPRASSAWTCERPASPSSGAPRCRPGTG